MVENPNSPAKRAVSSIEDFLRPLSGSLPEQKTLLRQALYGSPRNTRLIAELIRVSRELGDRSEVRAQLTHLSKLEPKQAVHHVALADLAIEEAVSPGISARDRAAALAEAERNLISARSLNSRESTMFAGFGRLYAARGEHVRAADWFVNAFEKGADAAVCIEAAKHFRAADKPGFATSILARAEKKYSSCPEQLETLADYYRESKDAGDAERLKNLTRRHPRLLQETAQATEEGRPDEDHSRVPNPQARRGAGVTAGAPTEAPPKRAAGKDGGKVHVVLELYDPGSLMRALNQHVEAGSFTEALKLSRYLLENDGRNPAIRLRHASVLLDCRRFDEYLLTAAGFPRDNDWRYLTAKFEFLAGNRADAFKNIAPVIQSPSAECEIEVLAIYMLTAPRDHQPIIDSLYELDPQRMGKAIGAMERLANTAWANRHPMLHMPLLPEGWPGDFSLTLSHPTRETRGPAAQGLQTPKT